MVSGSLTIHIKLRSLRCAPNKLGKERSRNKTAITRTQTKKWCGPVSSRENDCNIKQLTKLPLWCLQGVPPVAGGVVGPRRGCALRPLIPRVVRAFL